MFHEKGFYSKDTLSCEISPKTNMFHYYRRKQQPKELLG
jgi:hypothetical protein